MDSNYNYTKKLKLINLVRREPALWDITSDSYKVKEIFKKRIWIKIADEMNLSEKEVRSLWKSLKDYYKGELKKVPSAKTSSVAPTPEEYASAGTWVFFNEMSFFFNSARIKKYSSNMDDNLFSDSYSSSARKDCSNLEIIEISKDDNEVICTENDVTTIEDIDELIINEIRNDIEMKKKQELKRGTKRKQSFSEAIFQFEKKRMEFIEDLIEKKCQKEEKTYKEDDGIDCFLKFLNFELRCLQNWHNAKRKILAVLNECQDEEGLYTNTN